MSTRLITELAAVFHTPLTTIKGSVTAMMEGATGENRDARTALLAETLAAVDGLDSIVENLLYMNRLDTGVLKPKKSANDVLDLVSVAGDALRRQSRDYPLSIRIDENLPLVSMDFILMVKALNNVLQNVVRHTPAGTPVELSVEQKNRAIRFTIADRGPGVLPEELPSLFGRFFRGKNATHEGVGLGLSISKGIVAAHGGEIAASVNRQGGLSISLSLPIPDGGVDRRVV